MFTVWSVRLLLDDNHSFWNRSFLPRSAKICLNKMCFSTYPPCPRHFLALSSRHPIHSPDWTNFQPSSPRFQSHLFTFLVFYTCALCSPCVVRVDILIFCIGWTARLVLHRIRFFACTTVFGTFSIQVESTRILNDGLRCTKFCFFFQIYSYLFHFTKISFVSI